MSTLFFLVSFSIPKTDPSKGRHPYIFGGKMENEYELEGLHFHWGDKNNRGAEHVLNDVRLVEFVLKDFRNNENISNRNITILHKS